MNHRMSQYSLRSQIIAYYNSIKAMLDDFPSVRTKYFTIGLPQEKKDEKESKRKLNNDPRSFQPQPRCLLSSDGQSFLNLWFIPHPSETLAAFKMLPEKIGCSALRHTLQIVAPFHDIISYIFSFAQLGSAPGCLDYRCPSEHLTADWGGTEQIGVELLEIQKKIDSLSNPSDPNKVSHMLIMLKEMMFLQFEAAVRYSMRETFLSSGNVSAYQSITDNIYHALPPMSNAVFGSAFASYLQIPQLLDPHGQRASMLFPWRTFLANGGLFPVTISNLNPINSSMQLCLCGLSTEDQKVAHGELTGIQFIMEDVLWNSEILTDHREVQKPFRKQVSATSTAEAKGKALKALPDTMTSCALQRSYLIRWKQLEMLKAEWGRLKLKVEDINTVPLYKQFSELYEAEILCAAMRSIARHWGIEDEFEEYGTTNPCPLFPKEASKIDVITYQFQKLLESLEIHMIHDVQKKINREITLVLSEKAREERHLPIELWKHHGMQEIFSVTRPEIVESFIQRLMENHQEINAEIIFQKDHFEKCLTSLACDIMARERSNFETYSMFYENLLHQQHKLLYQKEQEMHIIEDNRGTAEVDLSQIAKLSHEMILEITALRARLTDLQREDHSIKEKIRKEVQGGYEALVQNIFLVCLQIKGKVDEYRLSMNKQMLEIISEVRKQGVEKIINLKKKFGSTKDNRALEEHLAQQGKLQELRDENSELEKLLCKLKAFKCWKETMQKAHFLATLREVEKEAIQNKNESLQSQMMAEEEAVLFNHQLRAARKVLAESQTENKKLKQQLEKQEYLLQEAEFKIHREFCKRQQLDLIKTANLEKMLENLGEREVKLLNLTEESEKSSKTRHLQETKMKKEIQQIRSQLTQERNLKLNAFQRIHELQCQLYDPEAAISQKRSPAVTRMSANLSHIARSKPYSFPGSYSCSQNAELPTFTLTRDSTQHLLTAKIKLEKIPRPKTVPSGWRNRVVDALLPDLTENSHSSLPVQQEQKPSQK
ncbi:coiled-coil domain-containing protein 162-like [Candoia aspera]|uniref:coiled-coil domain-containing protein 162-like n=1 Tax=Candoia aspera TaxID=51853 RepID=UPI002FD8149A